MQKMRNLGNFAKLCAILIFAEFLHNFSSDCPLAKICSIFYFISTFTNIQCCFFVSTFLQVKLFARPFLQICWKIFFPFVNRLVIYIYIESTAVLSTASALKAIFCMRKQSLFRFRLKLLSNITFLSYSSQKIQM